MVIICGEGGGIVSKGGAIWKCSAPVAVVVVVLFFFLQVIEII